MDGHQRLLYFIGMGWSGAVCIALSVILHLHLTDHKGTDGVAAVALIIGCSFIGCLLGWIAGGVNARR